MYLLINVLSVPNGNDSNSQNIVMNVIDNSVVAFANAVAISSFQLFASGRPGSCASCRMTSKIGWAI